MLRNAVGGGRVSDFPEKMVAKVYGSTLLVLRWGLRWCQICRKKHYEGVRFNVISVTRGWVDVEFPYKRIT